MTRRKVWWSKGSEIFSTLYWLRTPATKIPTRGSFWQCFCSGLNQEKSGF